ncbi:Phage tail protein [Pseudomonas antarctica]|uniref:Phage tail protein n=1 Tax=Pseudomonas antarctica TaxID=219572 RepID=A0A172YX78_9PSED|nr:MULTISPECIES: tail fiber assembly protein [Pseudomonas]ANF84668.1 Phage tail protein [Pseudomonas antarctica]AZF62190.1 Phage tail fiber assembly protein [Pseudomonas sp. LBUM920]
MNIYFYEKTLGFDVLAERGSEVPEGAVEISVNAYAELFEGQSKQKRIAADSAGYPILVDQLAASIEVQEINERAWRDTQLKETDGVIARHRDELEAGLKSTLSTEQYNELQTYRRLLRSWPESEHFPLFDHRPFGPIWFLTQSQ